MKESTKEIEESIKKNATAMFEKQPKGTMDALKNSLDDIFKGYGLPITRDTLKAYALGITQVSRDKEEDKISDEVRSLLGGISSTQALYTTIAAYVFFRIAELDEKVKKISE